MDNDEFKNNDDSFKVSRASMEALRATVTNNLMNEQNVKKKEQLVDFTYKLLSTPCDVDFRTIKRWVLGETETLGNATFLKVRDYINKCTLHDIESSARLFSWTMQSNLTHIIVDYYWGQKSFNESRSIFDKVEGQLIELISGYKRNKPEMKRTELLASFELKSMDVYDEWKELKVHVQAGILPAYSLPKELLDPDQVCKVAAFRIITDGTPSEVYVAEWDDVQPV